MATIIDVLEDVRRTIRSMERELDSNDSQVQRLLAKSEVLKDRIAELQCIEEKMSKAIEEDLREKHKDESEEDREAMTAFINGK